MSKLWSLFYNEILYNITEVQKIEKENTTQTHAAYKNYNYNPVIFRIIFLLFLN